MEAKIERQPFHSRNDLKWMLYSASRSDKGLIFYQGNFEIYIPAIKPCSPDCPLQGLQTPLKTAREKALRKYAKRVERSAENLWLG